MDEGEEEEEGMERGKEWYGRSSGAVENIIAEGISTHTHVWSSCFV